MSIFYHLDTYEALSVGQVLNLMEIPAGLSVELKTSSRSWFPAGVTHFGASILNRRLEDNALHREHKLERVRRSCYPDRPSRYVSVFACRTLAEITRLRSQFFTPEDKRLGRIWKVEGEEVFRADMNLFMYNRQDEGIADLYWRGCLSKTPLFEYLLKTPVTVLDAVVENEPTIY